MASQNILFPEDSDFWNLKNALTSALYSQLAIEDIAFDFATSLLKPEGPNSPFATQLSAEMRQSSKFRASLRAKDENLNIIFEVGQIVSTILREFCPSIEFTIEGREKSLFSELNKRVSKIIEGQGPQIQDLFALRVIILNTGSEKSNVEKCYTVANTLLGHFSMIHPLMDTNLTWDSSVKEMRPLKNERALVQKKFPQIYLPEESGMNKLYIVWVKDYIFFPNEKGYQSVHFILVYKGIPIEIQIRTIQMHYWASHGDANHGAYKKKKKFQDITLEMFDSSKILAPKYLVESHQVTSYPGLVTPIRFFFDTNV